MLTIINFTLGSLGCDRARLGIDIIGDQHNKYSDMNVDVDNDHLYNLSISEHAKVLLEDQSRIKAIIIKLNLMDFYCDFLRI